MDRELHVLIEDALLTIEAFPVIEATHECDDNDGEEQVDERLKPTIDDAGSATTSGSAPLPSKPKTKTQKAEPKRETVGDRVLADNPLARVFAGIPRLFLRDIRIRLIIRKDPKVESTDKGGDKAADSATANQPGPGDTMLELGIEFLSVSGGEDVLSQFQDRSEDDSKNHEDQANGTQPIASVAAFSSVGIPVDNNEYMIRHIRTGRGPSAGIWIQVFAPCPKLPARVTRNGISWAKQQWELATNFHLLRCSGLDIQARIHLGPKKPASSYSWFYDEDSSAEYDYYDDYTLDTMFVGFDTIAPGPQPPLPPMNPDTMSRGDTPIKANGLSDPSLRSAVEPTPDLPPVMHPGADKYMNDANGIQSCKVPSTFHRVSRGLLPGSCKHCLHLPSETCSMCWEEKPGVEKDSVLDDYIPMPGLALQITLRDPLEINMDRSSVETIHLLKTLFVKKRNEVTDDPVSLPPNGPNKDVIVPKRVTSNKDGSTKSTSSYFGFLSPKSKELEKEQINADAFSTNMQPENVQVLGVHLSEVIIRLHAMKEDNSPDDGLSFCYWDFLASCLTIDYQALKSVTKVSQDIRLDAGLFSWDEYCGVKSNRLVSLGIPLYSREENESLSFVSSGRSGLDDQFCNKTTWPSTACALMNIPPPLETLCYKDRKSHGVQMRFISVRNPEIVTEASRSLLNVRLGVTTTRFPWGFWRAINSTRRQITWGILGKPDAKGEEVSLEQTSSESQNASSPTSSIMTYSVQIDGGSIIMDPMIDMNMPLTRFAGERSSEAGISFEAIFDKLQMVYGKKAPGKNKVLSLQQLSVLPENVRTRILFCLDDLRPLEVALDVKKELNPFKRTLAVNKGILKMAKRLTRATRSAARVPQRPSTGARTRREYVMTELMKLDDRELNELWTVHQRHIKKRVKKRGSNDSTPLLGSTS